MVGKKLEDYLEEESSTGTGASATDGTGEQYAGKVRTKPTTKIVPAGWKPSPSIPNRPSDMMDYKKLFEETVIQGSTVKVTSSKMEHTGQVGRVRNLNGTFATVTFKDGEDAIYHISDLAVIGAPDEEDESAPTLNETYSQFRSKTSKRDGPEQLHKAVKEIKRKITELNKLLEYTDRLRSEIVEGSEDFKYKTYTERALEQIIEGIKHTYIKAKKLK